MGLRDRINDLFRRSAPAQETTTTTLTGAPRSDSAAPEGMYHKFKAETERRKIVEACRLMYKTDPRIKKMHRQLSRDIIKNGFVIRTKNEQALAIATDLQKRLALSARLDDYVRLSARDGDNFLQIEINDAFDIVNISRKPTLKCRRNSNDLDRFDDPARAYWIGEIYQHEPPANAAWLADWELIHARWEHDEGERYGTPMLASATSAFKRVSEGETDVSVRRKTRSGIRYLHVVEGASAGELQSYKEENKAALNNPTAAISDFFSNKSGALTVIQGDATLDQIDDVKHHIETLFAGGEVPMELVAYGGDLNRDVLGEKKAEYEDNLDVLRTWVAQEIIIPLLERQWLLKGILPESVNYSIEWRTKQVVTAKDIGDIADAAMRLRILGVPEEVTQLMLARFLPGVGIEMLMNADQNSGDAERMAAIMQQMRGGLA